MTIAETEAGTFLYRSPGRVGCLAMWQCTYSIGSEAVKGRHAGQHFVKCDAEGIEIALGNRWNDSFVRFARVPYRRVSRRQTLEAWQIGARAEAGMQCQIPSARTGR